MPLRHHHRSSSLSTKIKKPNFSIFGCLWRHHHIPFPFKKKQLRCGSATIPIHFLSLSLSQIQNQKIFFFFLSSVRWSRFPRTGVLRMPAVAVLAKAKGARTFLCQVVRAVVTCVTGVSRDPMNLYFCGFVGDPVGVVVVDFGNLYLNFYE